MSRTWIGKDLNCNRKRLAHTKTISFFTTAGILLFSLMLVTPAVFAADSQINCDAHSGACTQTLGERTVSLEIMPRPVKAMQDLVFKVSLSGPEPSDPPYIDLGMPAMKMGPNRVVLARTQQGFFEGKGVIVRCQSGRRTWFADVVIPGSGGVKFVFDVIY